MRYFLLISLLFLNSCVSTEATTRCGHFSLFSFATDLTSEEFKSMVDAQCAHSIGINNGQAIESKGTESITKGITEGVIEGLSH